MKIQQKTDIATKSGAHWMKCSWWHLSFNLVRFEKFYYQKYSLIENGHLKGRSIPLTGQQWKNEVRPQLQTRIF